MIERFFTLDPQLTAMAEAAQQDVQEVFARLDTTAEYNGAKVLHAFIQNHISEACLKGSTGYGYDDLGRDKLDKVFAAAMGAEDALVRHSFVSGTHSLVTALFGVLRPGDTMLSVTGKPYDTLEEAIGLRGEGGGSLKDFGIQYKQIDLNPDGTPQLEEIARQAVGVKMVYIQRSRGYSLRPSLHIADIAKITATAKAANPQVIVMVDNCYGEFVEEQEPCDVGVDLIAGSLIKNPGGGIANTGGYIAGTAPLIELCAQRLTCPGMGREVGCTLGELRPMFQGLFFAPTVVAAALKTAVFAAALFTRMGLQVSPTATQSRTDIIQAVLTGSPEKLCAFCRGIQKGSPIDSFVTPEPWAMPGYDSQVIMAAGAFTMGASIELSADAPLRPPYAVWLQGGLTYPSGKAGILLAAQALLNSSPQG